MTAQPIDPEKGGFEAWWLSSADTLGISLDEIEEVKAKALAREAWNAASRASREGLGRDIALAVDEYHECRNDREDYHGGDESKVRALAKASHDAREAMYEATRAFWKTRDAARITALAPPAPVEARAVSMEAILAALDHLSDTSGNVPADYVVEAARKIAALYAPLAPAPVETSGGKCEGNRSGDDEYAKDLAERIVLSLAESEPTEKADIGQELLTGSDAETCFVVESEELIERIRIGVVNALYEREIEIPRALPAPSHEEK